MGWGWGVEGKASVFVDREENIRCQDENTKVIEKHVPTWEILPRTEEHELSSYL